MNARAVHSIVAAGLHNPALLTQWTAEPETLSALGADAEGLDIATLRKFAGLVAMVRHNGLREDLPRSFQLLSEARLEIQLFADYAVHLARAAQRLAPGPGARAADLAGFVAGWIDREQPLHRRLHDLIRHELALMALAEREPAPPPALDFTQALADSVPVIVGALILHRFDHDPRLAGMREEEVMLGYWRATADAPLHILDLDLLGFELLRRLDGEISATQLAYALTGTAPSRVFLSAIDQLVGLGVAGLVAR